MSRQVWALKGGASSASAGFLAKLLLAWVPLQRRLRGSALHCLITEAVNPFKHVCSGRKGPPLTGTNGQHAYCGQGRAWLPQRENGAGQQVRAAGDC